MGKGWFNQQMVLRALKKTHKKKMDKLDYVKRISTQDQVKN